MSVPNVIRTHLVRVGNSMGLRLTRDVRELVGLEHDVELELEPGRLIIQPAPRPRAGWTEQIQSLSSGDEDPALQDWRDLPNSFDEEEWEW